MTAFLGTKRERLRFAYAHTLHPILAEIAFAHFGFGSYILVRLMLRSAESDGCGVLHHKAAASQTRCAVFSDYRCNDLLFNKRSALRSHCLAFSSD